MIFKFLIFVAIALLIYKFLGGTFPKIGKSAEEKKLDEDTLVECETCHTFVTLKESIIKDSKYYCSKECIR